MAIQVVCHDCGPVELAAADVQVRVCVEDNTGSYNFECPSCRRIVVRSAEPRIVDMLASDGVKVTIWQLPHEVFEVHEGPNITEGDIEAFHKLLETDGWDTRYFPPT
jgi:hypothetical protein